MGNVVTEEFISRAEALADFEASNAENPNWTPQRVKTLLLRQPAADVAPVVRCRDCIYFGVNKENDPYCTNRHGLDDPVPDGFCNYGDPKEERENGRND